MFSEIDLVNNTFTFSSPVVPTLSATSNDDAEEKVIEYQPRTTVPTHYGGSPNKDEKLHWSFLPREASLPHKYSGTIKRSPKAKKLFEKLFRGKFSFRFILESSTEVLPIFNSTSYRVYFYEDDNSPHPVLNVQLTSEGYSDTSIGFSDHDEEYNFFYNGLTIKHKQELCLRLLHNMMRQSGALLPIKLVKFLQNHLHISFGDNKNYEASLDVAICSADILVSQQAPEHEIALAFLKVGEGLEAFEDYATAAKVYEKAAGLADDDKRMQWHLWKFAGLAFKKHTWYSKSEEAYYRALHLKVLHDDRKLKLHDEDFRDLITNALYLYSTIMRLERAVARPLNEMEEREGVITSLLHSAGFRLGETREAMYLLGSVEHRLPAIKPQFLTPEGARLALVVAILKPTFDGFRKHLVSCLKPDNVIMVFPNLDNPYTINSRNQEEERKTALSLSRMEISKSRTNYRRLLCSLPSCRAWEQEDVTFKNCPCQVMYYCSPACQRMHWKSGHRQDCAHRKKQMKQQKGETD